MFKVIFQKHPEFVIFGTLLRNFKLNLVIEITEKSPWTPYLGVVRREEGDWEGRVLAVVKPNSAVAITCSDWLMLFPSLCQQILYADTETETWLKFWLNIGKACMVWGCFLAHSMKAEKFHGHLLRLMAFAAGGRFRMSVFCAGGGEHPRTPTLAVVIVSCWSSFVFIFILHFVRECMCVSICTSVHKCTGIHGGSGSPKAGVVSY